MRIRFNLRCVLVLALLLSFSLCRGQTVPGNLTFTFGTTNDGTQLWDLTGGYGVNTTVKERNGIRVPVGLGFTMVQDVAGNLRGVPGDLQGISLGGVALAGVNYTLSGKVTGAGGAAEVKFVVHFFGNASIGGFQNVGFSAVLTVDAAPNPNTGQLEAVVPAKFSAHFAEGHEGVSGTISEFAAALPPGVDGSWTLNLQMLGGNSLAGSATITTDAGQVLGFNVSGPLNTSTAVAKLHGLRGGVASQTINSASSSVIILSDVSFDDFVLNGKAMGQKLVSIPSP